MSFWNRFKDDSDTLLREWLRPKPVWVQRVVVFTILSVGRTLWYLAVFGVGVGVLLLTLRFWYSHPTLMATGIIMSAVASIVGILRKITDIIPAGGIDELEENNQ